MMRLKNLKVNKQGCQILSVQELSIFPGGRAMIEGANGSGKTTLMKVIAGLLVSYEGVRYCDFAPAHVVYVHQSPLMFRGSVRRNLLVGQTRQTDKSGLSDQIVRWCQKLRIDSLLDREANQLSGGEKKKVALIRALATAPRLLLLDEPLAELDDQSVEEVLELITELSNTGIIIAAPSGESPPKEFQKVSIEEIQTSPVLITN